MDVPAATCTPSQHQPTPPTGSQYELSAHGYRAVVTEQGATLRLLSHDGEDLVRPFPADASPQGCQGQLLVPWPNRIRDGHYVFDGRDQQLPLTEVERRNAIHGLANWVPWSLVERSEDAVHQRVQILAQPGWPGPLEVEATHRLGPDGLEVTITATNIGDGPLPFGCAAHPYLVCGDGPVDRWQVSSPFREVLEVDDRMLPVSLGPLTEDTDLAGAAIGDRHLDTGFTGVEPNRRDGGWQVVVSHGEHRRVLWGDTTMTWCQLFTPPQRDSLAVEPMTCGPDAFNPGPTHDDVIRLEPGQSTTHRWGLSV